MGVLSVKIAAWSNVLCCSNGVSSKGTFSMLRVKQCIKNL